MKLKKEIPSITAFNAKINDFLKKKKPNITNFATTNVLTDLKK